MGLHWFDFVSSRSPPSPAAATFGGGGGGGPADGMVHQRGFVPEGADLQLAIQAAGEEGGRAVPLTLAEAKRRCWEDERCVAITFRHESEAGENRLFAFHSHPPRV